MCIENGKITSAYLLKIYIWSVTVFNAFLINIRLIYVLNLIKVFMLLATAVLVIASTDVDKTGASYYGEQTLHYMATNGESAVVQLRECPSSLPLAESMMIQDTVPQKCYHLSRFSPVVSGPSCGTGSLMVARRLSSWARGLSCCTACVILGFSLHCKADS